MSAIINTGGWQAALQKNWGGRIAIAVAVMAVYLPSLHHAFQYDDLHSIVENPHLRSLANLDDFFVRPDMFTADPKSAMYRPLVLVSYAFNYAWGEYRVEGYRCFNILLHLANCLLVQTLVQRLLGLRLAGLASGLLFALHPIAGEPVNYISSRSESLCAFFSLASVLLYVRARERAALSSYWGSVSAFACALLAKSVGIVLPAVFVVREASAAPLSIKRLLASSKYHLAFWLLGIAYVVSVREALGTALLDRPVRDFSVQVFTQAKALVYYMKLLMMPWGQSVEHQFVMARGVGDAAVLAALGLLASCVIFSFFLWRRSGPLFFFCAWPSLFLLPTFIVPLNVLVNEHRLYIPTIGLASLLGWVLASRLERRMGVILLGLLVAAYGGLSLQRSQVWQDSATLWADALEKAPLMPRPHLFLGDVYKRQGRNQDAVDSYQRALTVNPAYLSGGDLLAIHNNMGAAYLAMQRNDEAMASYRRALAIDPEYAESRDTLEGLQALAEVAWQPEAEQRYKTGLKLMVAGQLARAVSQLQAALLVQSHAKIYQALGLAYERSGQAASAVEAYRVILRMPAAHDNLVQGARQRLQELGAGPVDFD